MREISEIIIHCTATKEGRDVTISEIDGWHRERGFDQIGYHYVVMLNGDIKTGRPEFREGAHCYGHNKHSIGVCYVGGLDKYGDPKDTRTPEQKSALLNLLKQLKKRYPQARIYGHKAFAQKDCPCFEAGVEYSTL